MSIPMDRRRFLGLGAIGVAGVAGVGVITSLVLPQSVARRPTFAVLFAERTAAVDAFGAEAASWEPLGGVEPAALLAMVPAAGLVARVVGERVEATLSDPAAFLTAWRAQRDAEVVAGDFVAAGGYLLTPSEAALAALTHIADEP
jgi:hypothetical protein